MQEDLSNHIDLRSDTVTKPTQKMREAMFRAEVGDDVYAEDPTVYKLQKESAQMFAFEDALFFPSGTQAALCGILTHLKRGEEYICGQEAHNYKYEAGGAAVLGGIQPQPLAQLADGTIELSAIERAIKPDDIHFAKTRLISLENTFWGRALDMDYIKAVQQIAHKHSLIMHLDGARIFNAAIAVELPLNQLVAGFDSMTVCMSKGIGAPVGSLLLGTADFINRARRWRKMTGGGMRQSGFLAAAAIEGLSDWEQRLAQDHKKAQVLVEALAKRPALKAEAHTNMVFLDFPAEKCHEYAEKLIASGFRLNVQPRTRLVMHSDVPLGAIPNLAEIIKNF